MPRAALNHHQAPPPERIAQALRLAYPRAVRSHDRRCARQVVVRPRASAPDVPLNAATPLRQLPSAEHLPRGSAPALCNDDAHRPSAKHEVEHVVSLELVLPPDTARRFRRTPSWFELHRGTHPARRPFCSGRPRPPRSTSGRGAVCHGAMVPTPAYVTRCWVRTSILERHRRHRQIGVWRRRPTPRSRRLHQAAHAFSPLPSARCKSLSSTIPSRDETPQVLPGASTQVRSASLLRQASRLQRRPPAGCCGRSHATSAARRTARPCRDPTAPGVPRRPRRRHRLRQRSRSHAVSLVEQHDPSLAPGRRPPRRRCAAQRPREGQHEHAKGEAQRQQHPCRIRRRCTDVRHRR